LLLYVICGRNFIKLAPGVLALAGGEEVGVPEEPKEEAEEGDEQGQGGGGQVWSQSYDRELQRQRCNF
jgi:hypothetical protein